MEILAKIYKLFSVFTIYTMYNLTYTKNKDTIPIAKLVGDKKPKTVYLSKNSEKDLDKSIDYEAVEAEMIKMKIKYKDRIPLMLKIEELHEKKTNPLNLISDDKNLIKLYKTSFTNSENETVLKAPFGQKFEIMPNSNPDKSSRYYICGMSESGKSHVAKTIINNYHSIFPERDIYLISKLKEDKTLDSCDCDLIRINPDTFLSDPFDISEFENSMVVFDDFDNFDKKLGIIINQIIDDICQMGRHKNISCIICTHFITNYKASTVKLTECNYYVVFPQSSIPKKLTYLLENYAGLTEKNIKTAKKMGRWVLVSRVNPQYLISENEIKILDNTD